jgi:DNA primase
VIKIDNDLPSIRAILEHYGASLRSTHGQVNLRCPFHSDSHQSGTANLDKNIFICFACGVQGNSIQIVAQQEGLKFNEAKQFAEGITGEVSTEVRGKYSSGRRLPSKQRNTSGGSTSGSIRRSRGA